MPSGSSGLNVQGALHVDRYLTNFSLNYIQQRNVFLSQTAASVIPVTNQSNTYIIYDRGYFWRDEAQPRGLAGRPQQVGYKFTTDSYSAIEYALEHIVDDRQRANVDDPIRLDENATNLLTQKMLIKQDRIWAQKFFVGGVWTTQASGVDSGAALGSNTFLRFDDPNSDPIGTIDYYKDKVNQLTGFVPNTLVLGVGVKRVLRSHPDIADRIKYTQIGLADDDLLAQLFNVGSVVVARSVYSSAQEGATNAFNYIVDPRSMWLGYIDPNPGLDSPTAIANFVWTGLLPGANNALGGVLLRGRDERSYSDYFHIRMAFDQKLVSNELGVFFVDATLS